MPNPRFGFQRRHRRFLRDNIQGVTKPAIRRLARRGGVVRMSNDIYDDVRVVLKKRLATIIEQLVYVVESSATHRHERKTVTVRDVAFVLKRLGTPVYGFGPT